MTMTFTMELTSENLEKLKILLDEGAVAPVLSTVGNSVPVAPTQPIADVSPPPVSVESVPQAVQPAPQPVPQAPVPQAPVTSTHVQTPDLTQLATNLVKSGKATVLQGILAQYGLSKLSDIYGKPDQISAFTEALVSANG